MRRAVNKPQTFWSARVSAEEKQEFKHLLPIHGAQTACFNIALEKFLVLTESNPELVRRVNEAVERHLHEETRQGAAEELTVNIGTNLYLRFNELFPQQGATSWFIRQSLHAINHQLGEFVLDERIELAIRSILRGHEDGSEQ